jgi:hypothetical protein
MDLVVVNPGFRGGRISIALLGARIGVVSLVHIM